MDDLPDILVRLEFLLARGDIFIGRNEVTIEADAVDLPHGQTLKLKNTDSAGKRFLGFRHQLHLLRSGQVIVFVSFVFVTFDFYIRKKVFCILHLIKNRGLGYIFQKEFRIFCCGCQQNLIVESIILYAGIIVLQQSGFSDLSRSGEQ